MPGIAADGSEDLPNRKPEIARYECDVVYDYVGGEQYSAMEEYELGEYVRFEDHMEAMREATAPKPAKDYLKQKLDTAYGELKIITDNIQLLKPNHIRQLLELNSMVSNILIWQAMDAEEREDIG